MLLIGCLKKENNFGQEHHLQNYLPNHMVDMEQTNLFYIFDVEVAKDESHQRASFVPTRSISSLLIFLVYILTRLFVHLMELFYIIFCFCV